MSEILASQLQILFHARLAEVIDDDAFLASLVRIRAQFGAEIVDNLLRTLKQPAEHRLTIRDHGQVAVAVAGDVHGNVYVQLPAEAFDVHGLTCPYRGLYAFTFEHHHLYAGREQEVDEALVKLRTPGYERSLLFVTGPSGSGKSSFAQAGVVPALETHYQQRNLRTRRARIRLGWHQAIAMHGHSQPLRLLNDAIQQLGMPTFKIEPSSMSIAAMGRHIIESTPAQQVNLIVFDQFEELFGPNVDVQQRDIVLAFLAELPPFEQVMTHIIVTVRSDFLPELYQRAVFYTMVKQGIELRTMTIDALKTAIQRPLQIQYPDKQIQPALLDRLAADTAADATYLPLLQVTLENIWQRGSLTLDNYQSLTAALGARADMVQDNEVDEHGMAIRNQPRPKVDREAIERIFCDLVQVSLDNDPRRDVRQRQTLDALTGGDTTKRRLVNELARARLLSVSPEPIAKAKEGEEASQDATFHTSGVEEQALAFPEPQQLLPDPLPVYVDIIHESLIVNWQRLQEAIAKRREQLQWRIRFQQALAEWQAQPSETTLLTGLRLAEAEALMRRDDIALKKQEARDLLAMSIAHRDQHQRLELERLQRIATAEATAARYARTLALVLALAAAITPAWLAFRWGVGRITASSVAIVNAGELTFQDSSIFVQAFQLEQFEVSNQQYRRCVDYGGCSRPPTEDYRLRDRAALPVTNINAFQAAAYCRWVGRRLPTVPEWLWAARGSPARRYPWGNAPPDPARVNIRFGSQPAGQVHPVTDHESGTTPVTHIYNLAGNVIEWSATPVKATGLDVTMRWNGEPTLAPERLMLVGTGYSDLVESLDFELPSLIYGPHVQRPDVGFRCAVST